MQRTVAVNTSYEELPLVNPEATKVESRMSKAGKTPSEESIKQDHEDAEMIMKHVDLGELVNAEDRIEANEKFLIDTMPGTAPDASGAEYTEHEHDDRWRLPLRQQHLRGRSRSRTGRRVTPTPTR